MATVMKRNLSHIEVVAIVQDMILLDTPEYIIRDALSQYGFYGSDADAILNEARELTTITDETHINPKMMAFGLALITAIMILMVALLIIGSLQS